MINKSLLFLALVISLIPLIAAAAECRDFVDFRYEPAPGRPARIIKLHAEDLYNADLTTGDDDVLHHPNLDIDL